MINSLTHPIENNFLRIIYELIIREVHIVNGYFKTFQKLKAFIFYIFLFLYNIVLTYTVFLHLTLFKNRLMETSEDQGQRLILYK